MANPRLGPIARRFPLLSPGLLLRRKALTDGLFGNNRLWQVVGVVFIARRILRKVMGADSETVAVERLQPGQTIILTGVRIRK